MSRCPGVRNGALLKTSFLDKFEAAIVGGTKPFGVNFALKCLPNVGCGELSKSAFKLAFF